MIRVHHIAVGVDGFVNITRLRNACSGYQPQDGREKAGWKIASRPRSLTNCLVSVHGRNVAPMAVSWGDVVHNPDLARFRQFRWLDSRLHPPLQVSGAALQIAGHTPRMLSIKAPLNNTVSGVGLLGESASDQVRG
jgi:hypothetical protein